MPKQLNSDCGSRKNGFGLRGRASSWKPAVRKSAACAARRSRSVPKSAPRSWGAVISSDDFRRLGETRPARDSIIEVRGGAFRTRSQSGPWMPSCDLLVGGCLASSVENGRLIAEMAARKSLIVEAGLPGAATTLPGRRSACLDGGTGTGSAGDGRHHGPVGTRDHRTGGTMIRRKCGRHAPDPHELLLSQCRPLDPGEAGHLCRRWPTGCGTTAPGRVVEETCGALHRIRERLTFASATFQLYRPGGECTDPQPRFVCSEGGIQPNADNPPGKDSITVFRGGASEVRAFETEPSPHVRHGSRLSRCHGEPLPGPQSSGRCPAGSSKSPQAVSVSAREGRTVSLSENSVGPLASRPQGMKQGHMDIPNRSDVVEQAATRVGFTLRTGASGFTRKHTRVQRLFRQRFNPLLGAVPVGTAEEAGGPVFGVVDVARPEQPQPIPLESAGVGNARGFQVDVMGRYEGKGGADLDAAGFGDGGGQLDRVASEPGE